MAIVNPTPANAASVHVDTALSDFATAYENREMIADRLSPIISVDKRSDVYFKRTRRGSSHIVNDLMSPKSPANETTYELSTGSYLVQDRGLMDYVPNATVQNADAALDPRQETVADIMAKLQLAREVRVASLLCTSGNYASGSTGAVSVSAWSNQTTSKPLDDINTAKAAIPPSGPGSKLLAFCAIDVWHALRVHPDLLALKGLDKGMLTRGDFASFFEIDELLVSDAQKDTNNPGQDPSYSRIWTGTVFGMVRVPTAPSTRSSAFSLTFRAKPGIQTSTWDEPKLGVNGCEGIKTSFSDDEVIVQNDMGYLITGAL
jgi:hypothetical protein